MSPQPATAEELSRLSIRLPRSLHNQFKAAVAAEGRSIQEVLVDYIQHYVSQRRPEQRRGGARK
jgi:metal-responsive CopG/Arc/MetJ family transcriptional regulator